MCRAPFRTRHARNPRSAAKITFVTSVVVLALAVMVMAVSVTLVAGLQLWRAFSRLSHSARTTADRVRPLAHELQQGTAVTTAELEALTESMERLTASRRGRSRKSR